MPISKEKLNKVRTVIAHRCPDGIASATIIRLALPSVEVQFHQYNTPALKELQATPGMLFVDFSPPEDRAEEFRFAGAIIMDHHKGAKDLVGSFGEDGIFADEKAEPGVSGALLAYRHIYVPLKGGNKDVLDQAILVGIRDTFQTTDPRWDIACATNTVFSFFGGDYWLSQGRVTFNETEKAIGKILVETRARQVVEVTKGAIIFRHKGLRYAIFPDPRGMASDVSERMRKEDTADGMIGFWYLGREDKPPKVIFNLRSNGKWNVAEFAKARGGGGHTKAAGFTLELTEDTLFTLSPYHVMKTAITGQ